MDPNPLSTEAEALAGSVSSSGNIAVELGLFAAAFSTDGRQLITEQDLFNEFNGVEIAQDTIQEFVAAKGWVYAKESEENWKIRDTALARLFNVLNEMSNEDLIVQTVVCETVCDAVTGSLMSLRTTLVLSACNVVNKMFVKISPEALEVIQPQLLATLIKLSGQAKKVTSTAGSLALKNYAPVCKIDEKASELLTKASSDINAATLTALSEFTANRFSSASFDREHDISCLEPIMCTLLKDSNAAVRAGARAAFLSYAAVLPERAKETFSGLEPQVKKTILKEAMTKKISLFGEQSIAKIAAEFKISLGPAQSTVRRPGAPRSSFRDFLAKERTGGPSENSDETIIIAAPQQKPKPKPMEEIEIVMPNIASAAESANVEKHEESTKSSGDLNLPNEPLVLNTPIKKEVVTSTPIQEKHANMSPFLSASKTPRDGVSRKLAFTLEEPKTNVKESEVEPGQLKIVKQIYQEFTKSKAPIYSSLAAGKMQNVESFNAMETLSLQNFKDIVYGIKIQNESLDDIINSSETEVSEMEEIIQNYCYETSSSLFKLEIFLYDNSTNSQDMDDEFSKFPEYEKESAINILIGSISKMCQISKRIESQPHMVRNFTPILESAMFAVRNMLTVGLSDGTVSKLIKSLVDITASTMAYEDMTLRNISHDTFLQFIRECEQALIPSVMESITDSINNCVIEKNDNKLLQLVKMLVQVTSYQMTEIPKLEYVSAVGRAIDACKGAIKYSSSISNNFDAFQGVRKDSVTFIALGSLNITGSTSKSVTETQRDAESYIGKLDGLNTGDKMMVLNKLSMFVEN